MLLGLTIKESTCPQCQTKNPLLAERCQGCQADLSKLFTCRELSCQTTQEASSFCRVCQTRLTGPLSNRILPYGERVYRLREWLGGGGMGEVYRAIEQDQQGKNIRDVAIKLNKEVTQHDLCTRFEREVAALARLQSPYSVKVYGYGEHKEDEILIAQYMIMELLEGITLQKYSEQGPLPSEEALLIFSQIASALREAHRFGVIHRDLKPNNIMLVGRSEDSFQAKLFDFGLSKDTSKAGADLSSSGVILGTLWYMSPEQARGEDIDQRSDIFSLGVILYQLLTGQLPFPASNLFELYQLHPLGLPPLVSRMPEELQEILRGCLAYRVQDRFRTLDACLSMLEKPLPPFTLKILPSSSELPRADIPLFEDSFERAPEELLGSRPWVSSLLTVLAILIVSSGFMAFLFYKRTLTRDKKTDLELRLPPSSPLQLRNHPQHRLLAMKSPHASQRSTPRPEAPPQIREERVEPIKKSRPQPPVNRRKKPYKKRPSRIRVSFSWPKDCSSVKLRGLRSAWEPLRNKRLLAPGHYKMLCENTKQRLRKYHTFEVLRSPAQQEVSIELQSFRQRIFIRPWAFLYMDGFFVKECQSACEIKMWSGTTKLVLKQCPSGVSAQRCLQQKHAQRVVLQRKLTVTTAIQPALKLRWDPKTKLHK